MIAPEDPSADYYYYVKAILRGALPIFFPLLFPMSHCLSQWLMRNILDFARYEFNTRIRLMLEVMTRTKRCLR